MLTLDDVHGYLRPQPRHPGVSLRVERGETVALVGRNGAARRRCSSHHGHRPRPRGRVSFDGADITGRDTHAIARLGITLVPEDRRIFPRLTVAENLRVPALAAGADAAALRARVRVLPRLRERLGHLGQAPLGRREQMLALARGFMARPKLMLIDELSGGLMPCWSTR